MKRYLFGAAAGVIAATCAQGASAQSKPPARPGEATSLEEVVVTAQRREERAQNVGIAISVLNGDALSKEGVTKVNQLQDKTPSLEIEPAFGSGQPQFRIRGVGFQDYAANNSPTVGVYIDEVAYPVPVMTQGMIFDINRVEVLRGPQGTLYGRNTTGGAINFITNRPTADFHAGVDLEYGRFDHFVGEGFVSGPISDTLKGRIAIGVDEGGAFQYNRVTGESLGDNDRVAGRAQLEWTPTPQLDVRLNVHGGYDHSEAQGLYLFTDFHTNLGFGPTIPADTDRFATGWGLRPGFAADNGLNPNRKPGKQNSLGGAALYVDYDFGPATLSNIASWEHLNRDELGDWDATQLAESDTLWQGVENVFSDELRLTSHTDGPLHYVAGLYYSYQTQNEIYGSDFTEFATEAHITYRQRVESIAGFAQADYALTDQLKLTGGIRIEDETRKLIDFTSAFNGFTALPPTNVETSMSPVTGKLELDFKPQDHVLFYASASKGVKSGGFTTYNTGNAAGIAAFKPETLYAYEIGAKTNLTPNFQLNASAFYYDYRNQQVLSIVCTANGAVGKFANAFSHIKGGEIEAIYQAGGLRISQAASYKKGHFTDFLDVSVSECQAGHGTVFVDRKGEPLKFPAWSYSGDVSYDWLVGNYRLTAQADYSWHDKYPSWLGPKYDVHQYWVANASFTVGPQDGPWSAGIWVRNLFNSEYDLTRNFFVNADIAQPGAPRTYGLRLDYRY